MKIRKIVLYGTLVICVTVALETFLLWVFGNLLFSDLWGLPICLLGILWTIPAIKRIKQKEKLKEKIQNGNTTAEDS